MESNVQISPQTIRRRLIALALFGFSSYLCIAILSFDPFDGSAFSISIPPAQTSNYAGDIGAQISASLFFRFGIASVFLIMPIFIASISLLISKKTINLWSFLAKWIGLTFCALITIPMLKPEVVVGNITLPTAGSYGQHLSEAIRINFGSLGQLTVVLTIMLMILLSTLSFQRIPFRFGKKTSDHLKPRDAVPPVKTSETPPTVDPQKPKIILPPAMAFRKPGGEHQDLESIVHQKSTYIMPTDTPFRCGENTEVSEEVISEHQKTASDLVRSYGDFGVQGKVVAIQPGPIITVFEFQASAGTKLAKLLGLADDIALALKVDSIFIMPVTGKNVLGIQIPNKNPKLVFFGDIVKSTAFSKKDTPLPFAIGKDIKGDPICEDIRSMPHLLMAGQTGSGKSVAINSLLCSILMKSNPTDVKMILVDPKILELKVYEGIPHLLMPVITEPSKASLALSWATQEMDKRYKLMELTKVRHIAGFNEQWENLSDLEKESLGQKAAYNPEFERLPYIMIVIDELADLMLTAPKDVEGSIQRLAQKARACGIHLILATQRPSVDVVTGVIKANLPCRIAFRVFSRGDSRTILDGNGAEKLLGKGDMLYLKPGQARLQRIQGAFLSDQEVVQFIDEIKLLAPSDYDEDAMKWIEDASQSHSEEPSSETPDDPKWFEALDIAQSQGNISASFLQRQLKIGYNRAARMIDAMEERGFISGADGSKSRQWLG